jgi:hypothetical protein
MSPAVLLLLLEALSTVQLQHMPAAAAQTLSGLHMKASQQQEGPGSLAVGMLLSVWLITAAACLFIFFSSPAAGCLRLQQVHVPWRGPGPAAGHEVR